MIIAYHRVSTREQHLDRGITSISKYSEENNIELSGAYTDQQTGENFKRPEYQFIKKRLIENDTLIISELDRLGRNNQLAFLSSYNTTWLVCYMVPQFYWIEFFIFFIQTL